MAEASSPTVPAVASIRTAPISGSPPTPSSFSQGRHDPRPPVPALRGPGSPARFRAIESYGDDVEPQPRERSAVARDLGPLQLGHEHASTTAIYTFVSSDFRTRTLRRALDATLAQATTETTAAAKAAATAGAVSATAAAVGPRPDGSHP